MRFTPSSVLIATTYFSFYAKALPVPNPVVSYQVVDVGGPTTTEAPSTLVQSVTKSSSPQTITLSSPATTVTEAPVTLLMLSTPDTLQLLMLSTPDTLQLLKLSTPDTLQLSKLLQLWYHLARSSHRHPDGHPTGGSIITSASSATSLHIQQQSIAELLEACVPNDHLTMELDNG
ncbi:Hypothetical predicted protein [Lecanosticta acicola]|uniref:Uncharacterized protein n=1 Tax=Lecanosticta acicola TaxID=111012 RepID=A0AAI9EE42_9PEZI|nr:Hypothetical predicted protein [Lecanosticta acicola]